MTARIIAFPVPEQEDDGGREALIDALLREPRGYRSADELADCILISLWLDGYRIASIDDDHDGAA